MTDIEELQKQLKAAQEDAKVKTKVLESTLATVSLLYQISSELSTIENKEKLYVTFLERVLKLFGAEIGIFYKMGVGSREYTVNFSLGIRKNEQELLHGPIVGVLQEVIREKKVVRDVSLETLKEINSFFSVYPIRATILAPIEIKLGVVGILQCSRLYDDAFTADEERVIRILLNKLASIHDIVAAQNKLKLKTSELERMNKLMIDRELKMVELKNELAKCLAKIGLG